ncbi:hypothetical protein, partial [Methylacidimicrobium cyclopophantes]|uniref:hypothetical protein n=1 Tax=Methylacidimicrobium cyclopophantes TaxID=1041766 RepID=UPI001C4993F6
MAVFGARQSHCPVESAILLLKTMKKAVATAASKFAAILPKAPTRAYLLVAPTPRAKRRFCVRSLTGAADAAQ